MTPPRRRKRSPEPGTSVTEPRRAAPARTRSGDAEPGRTSGRPPSVEGELAAPATTEPPRTSGRPPSAEGELAAPATIIRIGRVVLGGGQPLALIGGPCAIENEKHALETAERIATIAADRRVPFIYKSSYDMRNVVDKIVPVGSRSILLTERGTSFGYHNLVVDMRGLQDMRALGFPVVFDATHSVQLPGGAGDRSAGERKYVPALARAAVAVGIDALFMEMHEDPDRTLPDGRPLSDGPNMLRLDDLPRLLDEVTSIAAALAR